MKAVVVHGPKDLRIDEVADPVCGPVDVLVRMEWGGICGSDVAYWRSGISGTAVLRDPLILGHEVAGYVAEVGSEVDGVEVGAKVALYPASLVGDYQVAEDMRARTNLWPEVRYFGSAAFLPHEQGGFSKFRIVRPDQLRFLPQGVTTKAGALAEPFAVAIHAVRRAGDVADKTVLVNGAGPIGSLAVAAAKAYGARHVTVADLSEQALDIARAMGADCTINILQGQELPQDVDIAIEASGAPAAIGGVISATRRGGVVVQVGNLPGGDVSATLGNIVTREIEYRGSYRFADEMDEAIRLLDGVVDISPLQTHEFDILQACEAFDVAADRSSGSSKVMLKLS
ncbi:L-idonate 5-dehydrogenase [Arcanobacterium pluranimalium]|uniref:L-idonate 5-dehydrogenase n=1 Tax=Arcanobacterium pluranimalium TaxID=108028 RepID=UPI00195DB468|nr:L-idonate 5-dehydrogenase [Arcanobacterium pluranimalium]MBM7825042.1 L-idonate 5-dehydrogenase [Arcanobacterium pluranimalium]